MPPRRTVALVADTHGFLDPRVAALARAAEVVVHAGDVGGASILEALGAGGAHVVAVRGNNDTPRHWPPDDRAGLDGLPAEARVELPGGSLAVVHGDRLRARGRHERLRAAYGDAAAVVYGHSHRLAVDTDGAPWVLNPGAAGRSRTYGGPACLVLTADADGWSVRTHRFAPASRRRRAAQPGSGPRSSG